MVFALLSFDVAKQHSCWSPSADCNHLKWKSLVALLTTPSRSRCPFPHRSGTSHSSRICSSRSRLTHDSLLLPHSRGHMMPPSVSSNSMNSLVVEEGCSFQKQSRIDLLRIQVKLARTQTPLNHAFCPQPQQPQVAHPSEARGQLHVSHVHFTLFLRRHVALRQNIADLQSMKYSLSALHSSTNCSVEEFVSSK